MSDTLIKVENVSKKFCQSLKKSLWYGMQDLGNELLGRRHGGDGELRPDEFWAVKDVSFELTRSDCLALIGRSGASETRRPRMLTGLIKPDHVHEPGGLHEVEESLNCFPSSSFMPRIGHAYTDKEVR